MRFGTTISILHDLGEEFNNDLFLLLLSTFGYLFKAAAGKARFANGSVEGHNVIIRGMLTKLRNENF